MFSSTNPQSSHPKNLEKVDIWSFGVLIFEILSNCLKPNPSWDVNYPPASEDISLTPIYETLTSTGNGWKDWDKFPFTIERNFQNVAIVDKLWKTCDGCMIFDPEKRLSHGDILSTLSFLESINSWFTYCDTILCSSLTKMLPSRAAGDSFLTDSIEIILTSFTSV